MSAQPLQLADGTMIDPTTGQIMKPVEAAPPPGMVRVPTSIEAQQIVTRVRRTVEDLPAPPKNMNAISLVLMYTVFGMPDHDIAMVTDIPVDMIDRIRQMEAYKEMYNTTSAGMREIETNRVRDIFANAAPHAANRMVHLVNDEDPNVAQRAMKDVLDRAGHTPAQVVEHKHTMMNELRIVHVKREPQPDLPTVDATYEEIE